MAEDIDNMFTIEQVKTRYENQLLDIPAVVSVGIGLDEDGEKVIVIGLDGKQQATEQQLPSELEGFPVRVEIIGLPRVR